MNTHHSFFAKLVWWLTPLGRIRLALLSSSKSRDPGRTRVRMTWALDLLGHPRFASRPETPDLLVHVRWSLVRALIDLNETSPALEHARLLLAEPSAPADQAGELLVWALESLDRESARTLAESTSEPLRENPRIRTLRALCEVRDQLDDRSESRQLFDRIDPDLIDDHPELQHRAHILRVRCAEVMEAYEAMLDCAEAAGRIAPDSDQARYWRARALLHLGRGSEADTALASTPNDLSTDWERLARMAALSVRPGLDESESCVRLLEGELGNLDRIEQSLAMTALRNALCAKLDDSRETLKITYDLSGRVLKTTAAPWCEYNVALGEIVLNGAFERALERLDRAEPGFAAACPVGILAAACSAILGLADRIAPALASAGKVDLDLADDRSLLEAFAGVFAVLQESRRAENLTPLAEALGCTSGPLARAIPALVHVAVVLGEFVRVCLGLEVRFDALPPPDALEYNPWLRWLTVRIRAMHPDADPQACELSAAGPDIPLRAVIEHEDRIEASYQSARQALRSRENESALDHLTCALELCETEASFGCLTRARFLPLLHYWRGVTLAHMNQFDAAADALSICVEGPRSAEALAQLGLISCARGDLGAAGAQIARIPDPQPSSARYLAALIAERSRNTGRAVELLDELGDCNDTYSAAALRLRGAIEERRGDPASAARYYREALALCPGDAASSTRLARLWLRDVHDCVVSGRQDMPDEPKECDWTSVVIFDWATGFLALRDWLLAALGSSAPPKNDHLPLAPGALRRLMIRVVLADGLEERARQIAADWDTEGDSEPDGVAVRLLVDTSRCIADLCRDGGTESRSRAQDCAAKLAALSADLPNHEAIAFWRNAITVVLDSSDLARKGTFAGTLANIRRPDDQRLLAALLCLFSPDESERRQAASVCRQLIEQEVPADPARRSVGVCLAALAECEEAEFLSAYSQLEEDLSAIPCPESVLYLAASEARLRRGEIDEVAHGHIPESLADLADPEVRRVVAFAYAQRAAHSAERDVRSALNDIEQAIELLETAGDN